MMCSSPCDGGVRYRDVACYGSLDDKTIKHYPVDDASCSADEMVLQTVEFYLLLAFFHSVCNIRHIHFLAYSLRGHICVYRYPKPTFIETLCLAIEKITHVRAGAQRVI